MRYSLDLRITLVRIVRTRDLCDWLDRARPYLYTLGMPTAKSNPRHGVGLDALILAVLGREPAHGYAILSSLRESSNGVFDLPEGTLYPILHRLERQGLVRACWQSVAGRERKVYSLTRAGRTAVETGRADWEKYAQAVVRIFGAVTCPPTLTHT